jgi:hypothetical protein
VDSGLGRFRSLYEYYGVSLSSGWFAEDIVSIREKCGCQVVGEMKIMLLQASKSRLLQCKSGKN